MANDRRYRTLQVGPQRYLWRTYHRHRDGQCAEVLRLRPLGAATGLSLYFEPGPGRAIPQGGTAAAGVVTLGTTALNLNLPGVVRAFLDSAVAAADSSSLPTGNHDGWALFPDAAARRTRQLENANDAP